jgi:hypothetical protein
VEMTDTGRAAVAGKGRATSNASCVTADHSAHSFLINVAQCAVASHHQLHSPAFAMLRW